MVSEKAILHIALRYMPFCGPASIGLAWINPFAQASARRSLGRKLLAATISSHANIRLFLVAHETFQIAQPGAVLANLQ